VTPLLRSLEKNGTKVAKLAKNYDISTMLTTVSKYKKITFYIVL